MQNPVQLLCTCRTGAPRLADFQEPAGRGTHDGAAVSKREGRRAGRGGGAEDAGKADTAKGPDAAAGLRGIGAVIVVEPVGAEAVQEIGRGSDPGGCRKRLQLGRAEVRQAAQDVALDLGPGREGLFSDLVLRDPAPPGGKSAQPRSFRSARAAACGARIARPPQHATRSSGPRSASAEPSGNAGPATASEAGSWRGCPRGLARTDGVRLLGHEPRQRTRPGRDRTRGLTSAGKGGITFRPGITRRLMNPPPVGGAAFGRPPALMTGRVAQSPPELSCRGKSTNPWT